MDKFIILLLMENDSNSFQVYAKGYDKIMYSKSKHDEKKKQFHNI